MATNTEEIVVKFRTEGGQEVEETFRRAADAGEHFHSKITKAGSALGDLRAKSEARVASNIGAIAQSMVGGANAGELLATTITKIGESFRGSLLFAGAATVGFSLYEGITRAGEAATALDTKILGLRRDTSVSGDFLGADKVNQNLTDSVALVQQLRQRFITERTGLGGQFNQALRGALELRTRSQLEAKDAQQIADARKSVADALDQQADKQRAINNATRQEIFADERLSALEKERIAHKEKLNQISAAAASIGIQGVTRAEAEEKSRTELANSQINKQADLRELSIQHASDLNEIERSGLNTNQQRIVAALREVEYRKQLVDHAKNFEERASATLDLEKARGRLPQIMQIPPLQSEQNDIFQQAIRTANIEGRRRETELFRRNTPQGQMQEYQRQQGQRTSDYYQNIQDSWDIYNLRTYGRLNRPRTSEEQNDLRKSSSPEGGDLYGRIGDLIQTLRALPAAIGVQ